jgi:hypothetical protein
MPPDSGESRREAFTCGPRYSVSAPGFVRRQLGSSACSQDGRTSTARTPRLVQGPGQPGGLPGGGVTPDARAPGPVLGLDSPRPAWPYALSGSCNIGHFLSWTRMVPSTATMWCIVLRSDAATGGPQAAPTQLGPCPPDADSDWACRSDRPAPSNGRADALPALTPEPRAHAPGWPWPLPGVSSDPRGHGPPGTITTWLGI